ncbi:nucleoside deaminase [Nocardia sp. NPDC058379]|uniref:nucleoside deaminase n=1 Tax=unclassified Nocardia TaxID=2637762 RepID=UPI0036631871
MSELTTVDTRGLIRAIEVAAQGKALGNLAFGAVLFDDQGTELGAAYNTVNETGDCTDHAETRLVRLLSPSVSREQLSTSTLYASCEPCAMCSGAIFSAGIGTVVFALASRRWREMTDQITDSRPPSLLLTCAEVLGAGERTTLVHGGYLPEHAESLF